MFALAKTYAIDKANKLEKITMMDFFKDIHRMYYSKIDISFMEYFLELSEHEGEFVVPHTKLIDYGIMTSTRSNDIKDKLDQLKLEIETNYLLRDVPQWHKSGTKHSKLYMLTPESFKLCLMRSQRRAKQSVDPIIYANYYLLLECVFKLYTIYEKLYATKLMTIKDDKIDKQSDTINQLKNTIDIMLVNGNSQSNKIDKLITFAEDSNTRIITLQEEVSILNDKLDILFDYFLSFARMSLTTWIGSTVIKQQFDTLCNNKDNNYAFSHLKVLFMVGFHIQTETPSMHIKTIGDTEIKFKGRGMLKIYSCCTNFSDIRARIKLLYNRHTDDESKLMFMLKPTIITLISCEVNVERIILENFNKKEGTTIFPEESMVSWDSKYKSYNIIVNTTKRQKAQDIFNNICEKASKERFQGYQQRIDNFNINSNLKVDQKVIDYIDDVDHKFFSSTKPFCQKYIDSYSIKTYKNNLFSEYCYNTPGAKGIKRDDVDNRSMTNTKYSLHKIGELLEEHSSKDHVKIMTDSGILTKENLPVLKEIAKYENIDTSELEEPSEYDSESGSDSE
jgi:hypothetical protein